MTQKSPLSPAVSSDPQDAEALHRDAILKAHGADARIRLLQDAQAYGAAVFVADIDNGPRHVRLLGAFGSAFAAAPDGQPGIVTLSAMDLIRPARLELDYARLMSLAFALCDRQETALLLGLGGGDIWRFVCATLPDCAVTLVELDEDVAAIARRWFYLDQPVIHKPAEQFVGETSDRFDVLLVDFYDGHGNDVLDADFWMHCLDALAPGGCIATNWLHADERSKAMAEAQIAAAHARGHGCFFITPRDPRGNVVQFLPTAGGRGADGIETAVARFITERGVPEAERIDLKDYIISATFPAEADQ